MRNLIVAAFLEPVTDGLEFPRDDWPLHVTLARFDVDGPGSASAPGPDQLAGRIAGLMAAPVTAALGGPLTAGGVMPQSPAGPCPAALRHNVNAPPVLAPRGAILGSDSMLI
ncbi:hypothetical protein [Arthrobacter sp. UYCu712]|uniref:hypothetical protein n=1 Tax=Arthrobacter sp. UYCu712 TaxID=3156340 RepID=UPI003392FCBB